MTGGGEAEARHARTRVLSLQAVDRRRRGARLLDHDRGGAHRRICPTTCARPGSGCARPLAELGEQRIYASHNSHHVLARRRATSSCVPKRKVLEVCVFLGRALTGAAGAPRRAQVEGQVRATSFDIQHRDEVEPPLTDWLREAYQACSARMAAAKGHRKRRARALPVQGDGASTGGQGQGEEAKRGPPSRQSEEAVGRLIGAQRSRLTAAHRAGIRARLMHLVPVWTGARRTDEVQAMMLNELLLDAMNREVERSRRRSNRCPKGNTTGSRTRNR